MKTTLTITIFLSIFLLLTGCGGATDQGANESEDHTSAGQHEGMDHSSMNHSSDGTVPEGLEKADNPAYPVGSTVIIEEAHMEGMKGAEATVTGAFNTIAYVVSYTPTDGGERVENHKWVIHEEIENPGQAPLEPGTEVTLNASHMSGMDGATAVIEKAVDTTVYMVSYTSESGEKIENHKWMTEEELKPVEETN